MVLCMGRGVMSGAVYGKGCDECAVDGKGGDAWCRVWEGV